MSAVAARTSAAQASPHTRTTLERLLGAVSLLTVFTWLCLLYAWQAWGHVTPWLFGDELELTQFSRSIAETGQAARRGEPHSFETLYAYMLAPVWWISDTHSAYAAAKYLGVLTMTSAFFPAYALARMIVSYRWALFAAATSAAIPALAYASLLIEEPLAYPYATLCLFLLVKALTTRRRAVVAAAVAAALVAPLVRSQLAVIPAVFALAALLLAWASERAREWRSRWSAWDWAGAALLLAGAAIALNAMIASLSQSWFVATGPYKGRMLEYGLWAAGALTIGLGVMPVVAGLTSLSRPRDEQRAPAERAFVAVLAASIVCFAFYTAVKAAYISTVFATRVTERNLIYLSPLLLAGTALLLERRRLRLPALAGAAALALYLILTTPYQMDFPFYSDAPGLAVLAAGNRNFAWTPETAERILLAMLAASVAILLLPLLLRGRQRILRGALGVAAALVLAWNLTAEIAAASASHDFSSQLARNLVRPFDWVDRTTKGQPTMYLGQRITDPNGVWLLEFWNRSIRYVWSLDGTAPGPGPVVNPNMETPSGKFQQQRGDLRYVVADEGVSVVGRVVDEHTHFAGGTPARWRLFEIEYPLRLQRSVVGVYPDGWMGGDASYSQHWMRRGKPGYAVVTVSRAGWGGPDVPGGVRITVGKLVIDSGFQPRMGRVTAVRRWTVHSHLYRRFVIPTPAPPFRVEVNISPTFVPAEHDPRISDRRELGAIVGFAFRQTRPRS